MGFEAIMKNGHPGADRGVNILPPCPSALLDNVYGQGGQSVRFLENNATYNANLALKAGKVTNKSSGFIVR